VEESIKLWIINVIQSIDIAAYSHSKNYLKNYISRKDRNRIPKQILRYSPSGKRSIGSSAKRWSEYVADQMVLFIWRMMKLIQGIYLR
jgi:hypothetical protein